LDNPPKDLIVAVLGAAVGLAGLLLIFSGFLFAQAASFPRATTDDEIIDKFRNAGRFAVVPFVVCLAVAAIATSWMLSPSPTGFAWASYGFLAALALSAGYGGLVILKYL
jgi:hypothetical protein